MLRWNRRILCYVIVVMSKPMSDRDVRNMCSKFSFSQDGLDTLSLTKIQKTLNCGYLQLHSTTSGELPVSSLASTPMFVYYNIRETGKQCKRRDSGEVVERQGARKSMLRAGVSCLEPNDYNYGNDDFESGFQGATGLTMRFRQPQALK